MTTPHKATPSDWRQVETHARANSPTSSVILELRDRLAAAEQRIQALEGATADHVRDAPEMVATDDELYEPWDRAKSVEAGLRAVYNLGLSHGAAQATCPHIISSDDGTSYCGLAEQGANSQPTSNEPQTRSSAPVSGLVEQVAIVIGDGDQPAHYWEEEARAAIHACADWIDAQDAGLGAGCIAARWLREEVNHGPH